MARQKLLPSRTHIFSFLLVLFVSTAVTVLITRQIIAFQHFPFDFDEANHANGALALYLELRALDLNGFVTELMSQGFYPPGFSWMKAVAFYLFGASSTVARMFSVVSFFLALITIYALPLEIDSDLGWLAGIVAVAFTVTMQPLLVTSALVMMEAPGLLATFAMLWLYLRAVKLPSKSRLIAVSLLLILTFLTKYTYGVIAAASLALMELTLLAFPDPAERETGQMDQTAAGNNGLYARFKSGITQRWIWLFGPFLAALAIWFIGANNLQSFFSYATAQPPDQPWVTWENLFFYPQSFVNQFVPSPPFAVISLLGLLYGLWRWRDPLTRVLLIYFLVGMLVMTVNLPKNPRFIVTIAPALHILTGLMLSWTVTKFSSAGGRERTAAAALVVFMVAGAIISIPTVYERYNTYHSLMEVEYETSPQSNDIMNWIGDQIPPGERFFVLNYWDQLSPQRIAWHLGTDGKTAPENVGFDDLLMPSALVQEPTADNITDIQQQIQQSNVNYIVLFEGGGWGFPFWPEYNQAMQNQLEPLARESFEVSYFDTKGWEDKELLTQATWDPVKEKGQYTLDIDVIIHRVHPLE